MPGATVSPAAPPAGSPRWYAWLFTPRDSRETVALLFQLEAELRGIVFSPRDHGVAHLKLHWWRDEIQRLAAGSPRHPMTQELALAVPEAAAAWRPLPDFLTSLELELAAVAIDDEAELDRFLALADGLTRAMVLALSGGTADAECEQIGAGAGQAVRGAQIAADWCKSPMDEQRRSTVLRLAERSRTRWADAGRLMDLRQHERLRGLRVLGELQMAMLDRLEAGEFRPDSGRPALPALQSLWTAWRAARQH